MASAFRSFNRDVLMDIVNDVNGPIANEFKNLAESIVVKETKEHLSQNSVDEDSPEAHKENPDTKRPRKVTGRLHDNIVVTEAAIENGMLVVGVGADPVEVPYARVLLGWEDVKAEKQSKPKISKKSGKLLNAKAKKPRQPRVYQLAPDRFV